MQWFKSKMERRYSEKLYEPQKYRSVWGKDILPTIEMGLDQATDQNTPEVWGEFRPRSHIHCYLSSLDNMLNQKPWMKMPKKSEKNWVLINILSQSSVLYNGLQQNPM